MTKKKLRKSSWQTQKMGIVSFVQALSTLWCINLTYAFTLGRLHTLSKLRTRTSLYASRSLSTVQKRTHECLDYQLIINELASLSKTTLGAQLCKQFHASGVSDANRNYAMVDEISGQLDYLPIRSNLDVWKVVSGIENNTSPPDRSDLVRFSSDMEHIGELHSFFESNAEQFKLFGHLITELALPAAVSETFASSFDHDNNLSIDKYPTIRVLQGGIEALRARITKTIQSLLLLQGMQDKVADRCTVH